MRWQFWKREPIPNDPPRVDPRLAVDAQSKHKGVSFDAVRTAGGFAEPAKVGREQFRPPKPPAAVAEAMALDSKAKMAMDSGIDELFGNFWADAINEGLSFPGFPYLSQLTLRSEYRRPAEIIAKEMTRKWVKLTAKGDEDKTEKLAEIEEEFKRFRVQAVFREAIEHDGFFGRAQIFIDLDNKGTSPEELKKPLATDAVGGPKKIKKDSLVGFRCVEPIWTYPNGYNSTDPLDPTFYKPQSWFVMGKVVHSSRLLTIVSRQVPDLLKPAYSFGGLSLSQMAKPYVDNWLRTRQSVSDIVSNFSTLVLQTNMASEMTGGPGGSIVQRLMLMNALRSNNGTLAIDKETEDFRNVSVPLGSLDKLQAQAQEHMSACVGIPLIVLFGITPSGLNGSSESELQVFAGSIEAQQEVIRPHLHKVLDIIQLNKYGEIDPDIGFAFEPLRVLSETELAAVRKTDAETDAIYMESGALSPTEVRTRLAGEEDSPYAGIDIDDLPEPPQDDGEDDPQGPVPKEKLDTGSGGLSESGKTES